MSLNEFTAGTARMLAALPIVSLMSMSLMISAPTARAEAGAKAEAAKPIACTVIVDEVSSKVLYRQGSCDQQFSPMSSFKLPLAMMGYDAGILEDATRPRWDYKPEWNRSERERKATDPTIWLKDSIVWYSQEITRRLGPARFKDYVKRFDYGNADVAGVKGQTDGLTEAWLMSSLKISADQQVRFLRDFRTGKLPISKAAMTATAEIVPHFQAGDGWDVQGKTGSGWLRDAKGAVNRNRPLGWFVGWAVQGERRVVFARLEVGNRKVEQYASIIARDGFLAELPELAKGF